MAKITIRQVSKPYCLWCDSTEPATKAGWIEHHLPSSGLKVHFCSKKCLASATYQGKGKILDAGKIGDHYKQKERTAIKTQFKKILEKDRMDENDFSIFFLAMSTKQKQTLACIGLAALMGRFFHNPKKILAEIDRVKG
jgi:hypothetical protein